MVRNEERWWWGKLEIATGPREVCVLEGLGNHELDTHELPEKLCLEMV